MKYSVNKKTALFSFFALAFIVISVSVSAKLHSVGLPLTAGPPQILAADPEIEKTNTGWEADLRGLVSKDLIDTQKVKKLYVLRDGLPFSEKYIRDDTDLTYGIRDDKSQHDYGFYIELDRGRVITSKRPIMLGEYNPRQHNTVYYYETEDTDSFIENDFVREVRLKLLNNLTYVVKDTFPGGEVQRVELLRNKDDYTVRFWYKNLIGVTRQIETGLDNKYLAIKFDDAFNKNSFLWDESIISWIALQTDWQISKSTLDFWYSLQITDGPNKGLIPREIRTEYYKKYLKSLTAENDPASPLSFHLLNSPQVNNPFLLGRIELTLYTKTGDINRLRNTVQKLVDYYNWVEKNKKTVISVSGRDIWLYGWDNEGTGMDNSPRCLNYPDCGYSDLISQQSALASDISAIYKITGNNEASHEFDGYFNLLSGQIRTNYLDPATGFIYDLNQDGNKIKSAETLAFIWTLYSDSLSNAENENLIKNYLLNNKKFGSNPMLPSVSRDSSEYRAEGHYWEGGIWPPMIWITYTALKDGGHEDSAENLRRYYLNALENTYARYGTLYEYYSPTPPYGSGGDYLMQGKNPDARDDFFGWGALPLGFYSPPD